MRFSGSEMAGAGPGPDLTWCSATKPEADQRSQRWHSTEARACAGASSNHSSSNTAQSANDPPKISIPPLWSIAAECSLRAEGGRLLGDGSSVQVRACRRHETACSKLQQGTARFSNSMPDTLFFPPKSKTQVETGRFKAYTVLFTLCSRQCSLGGG